MGGVTSNPSIFEKAIAESHDYDEAIQQLIGEAINANITSALMPRARFTRNGRRSEHATE